MRILDEVRDRYGFSLVGYVVMPEHVHLLISEPARRNAFDGDSGSEAARLAPLARQKAKAHRTIEYCFAGGDDSLPRFWQRRFYDFNVWSLKKRVEKLDYMHMNPLKRKLVDHPKDWPWSSFSFYAKPGRGLIRVDPIHWVPGNPKNKPEPPTLRNPRRIGHPENH